MGDSSSEGISNRPMSNRIMTECFRRKYAVNS